VVIYLRVSTDQQNEESQLKPCKALCTQRGYEVVDVYSDHARSAYKTVFRPGWKKVMNLVYKRSINHIVVWALESFLDEINIPGEIGIHLRNFLIGFLGYTAQQESVKKSQRIKDSIKFQKARKKGKVGRPILPNKVKKEVADALKRGDSYRTIHQNVNYKIKYGKVKFVSIATISNIARQCKR